MSAYIIADVTVTNDTQYAEYRQWSTAAMQAYAAKVLVRGGDPQTLEGDWAPTRIVVLEFPDAERARAFNDSPEYGRAREARRGAAIMRMVLVQGA
jgi:uncharacterized protein (DUF1330 family)